MAVVSVVGKSRAKNANVRTVTGKSRGTNCLVSVVGKSRAAAASVISVVGKSRGRAISLSTLQNILQPLTTSYDDTTLFHSPDFSIKYGVQLLLYDSGHVYDLTDYIVSYRDTRRKNDLSTWTITLQDEALRYFAPYQSYGLKLQPDFYQSSYVLKKWLKLNVLQGDETWRSSNLIITDFTFNSKQRLCTISGADKCRHLYIRNQNMDPWKSTTAKTVVADILQKYKIDDYVLNFKDYPIREYNFTNETPIDKINDILWVGMAHWFYKNDVFYAYSDEDKLNSHDWIYTDRHNIYEVEWKSTLGDYYNEITLGRTAKINNMCEIEGKEFGFHMENLCAPLLSPKISIEYAHNGEIILIFSGNDGGSAQHDSAQVPVDWLPPGQGRGYGGPATWISFAYKQRVGMVGPNLGNAITGYKLRVSGMSVDEANNYGTDPNYTYHYVDQAGQAKYGIWKYPSIVDNPLIPNTEWAKVLAKWILKQYARNLIQVSLTSSVNLFSFPCDTLVITDYGSAAIRKSFLLNEASTELSQSNCISSYSANQPSAIIRGTM